MRHRTNKVTKDCFPDQTRTRQTLNNQIRRNPTLRVGISKERHARQEPKYPTSSFAHPRHGHLFGMSFCNPIVVLVLILQLKCVCHAHEAPRASTRAFF